MNNSRTERSAAKIENVILTNRMFLYQFPRRIFLIISKQLSI